MLEPDRLLTDYPELLALAVLLFGVFVTRWSAKRAPATRLLVRLPTFLLFTYFLFRSHAVPYLAATATRDAFERIVSDGFRAIWWFWGASIGANAIRNFSWRSMHHTGQKFFIDLCVAGIYLFAFFGLITFVLNFPTQTILVTSSAVAVVLGFALQSSLGDVFYGIVLNLGKPYREGDWIVLDNGVEGRVLEMNWRATHMLTIAQDLVIVPNSIVAKSKLINSSFPSSIHGTSIQILLDSGTFPSAARRILSEVLHGCHLVLLMPGPLIVIKSLSQEALAVDITFFTAEIGQSYEAQNQVFDKLFRALGASATGFGTRTTAFQAAPVQSTVPDVNCEVERLIAFTPAFSRLTAPDRTAIAALMVREEFDAHKTVQDSGVNSDAMYVVGSGVLSLTSTAQGQSREIARLGIADHFGAGGLLNGDDSMIKVITLTPAVVYRLEKKDLMRLINDRPGFATILNQELAARKVLARNLMEPHAGAETAEDPLATWFSGIFHRPDI